MIFRLGILIFTRPIIKLKQLGKITTCGRTADSPGKFQELRPAEIAVHAALFQGDQATEMFSE